MRGNYKLDRVLGIVEVRFLVVVSLVPREGIEGDDGGVAHLRVVKEPAACAIQVDREIGIDFHALHEIHEGVEISAR